MGQKKGFLTIEYAVFILTIILALLAMSIYLGRALSGRWREAADSFGFGRQYYPGAEE